MDDSKELRKHQPLHPSEIGLLNGSLVGVFHNWDSISIVTSIGDEIFSWESDSGLIHETRLVAEKYLVVTLGASVSVLQFQVYCFENKSWSRSFPVEFCDYTISGIHPTKPWVGILNKGATEIWNVGLLCKTYEWEGQCFDLMAFGNDEVIAALDDQSLFLLDSSKAPRFLKAIEGDDIVALDWLKPNELLVLGYLSGVVSLYNLRENSEAIILNCKSEIDRLCVVPQGEQIIVIEEAKSHIYNLETGTCYTVDNSSGLYIEQWPSRIAVLNDAGISFTSVA